MTDSRSMSALNDRQKRFVIAMLETGGTNFSKCAKMAGYTGDVMTLKVTAHRLAHDDKIIAAIKEEGSKRMSANVILATSELVKMIDDPGTRGGDKLKAIEMLLNRTGLHALTESKVLHQHEDLDQTRMLERIGALAKQLGVDPQKLIGTTVPQVKVPVEVEDTEEAEFVEVGNPATEDWSGI